MQNTINPLLLDEYSQPKDWVMPAHNADQDSAYGSGGTGESSTQQNSGVISNYINPDLTGTSRPLGSPKATLTSGHLR
ncbi:hypothetical protein RRF57_001883 [Xylaria bambusicola]|uniref:Uncharacterized protein n=1 Tax=Xylaria bambusicola TaxID=326684 RepID=A0AAN7Z3Z5_9PEZI